MKQATDKSENGKMSDAYDVGYWEFLIDRI